MKLTKDQVTERRAALCKVLIEIAKKQAVAGNIKKDLAEDFEKNEKAYREGILTAEGVIYRKPRWDVSAKEKVDAGE